jgi:phosphatidylserine/phosphatidylglycerophosphate/cardiolipin synthase-like enzyme
MMVSKVVQRSAFQHQAVLFGAKALKPVQPNEANGIKWYYGRPQTSDFITHSDGHQTKVTSLIDGGQIFNRIDALLDKAKSNVMVDIYELQDPTLNPDRTSPPDTPGAKEQQRIVSKLIDLTKRGIKVRVVMDNSYDSRTKSYHNQAVIDHLRANGVEVLAYPNDKAKISHVKMLIVDNQFAVIGGMNWGGHSPVNHDACVMLEGKEVGNLAAQIFKVDYEFSGGDISTLQPIETVSEEKIKILTTSPKEAPDGGGSEIYDEITRRIDHAQHSIVCELFSLTDKTIADKLIAAHQRLSQNGKPGVKILVDPGLYLKFANCRPTIDLLSQAGIPIRFFKPNWENEEKLHGKWAVFDEEELFIGSANWSKAGLKGNPKADKTAVATNKTSQAKPAAKKPAAKKPVAKAPATPSDPSQPKPPSNWGLPNHEANIAILSKQLCVAFLKQFQYDWNNKSTAVQLPNLIASIPETLRDEFLGDDLKASPGPNLT